MDNTALVAAFIAFVSALASVAGVFIYRFIKLFISVFFVRRELPGKPEYTDDNEPT